jgi:hypothetical protein
MVAQQRIAVFRLVVVGLTLAAFAAGANRFGVWRGECAFACLALLAAEPVLFRRSVAGAWDERDRLLHLRAIQWGTAMFWLVTTVSIWAAYAALRPSRQVPVESLALLAWLEATAYLLCNAGATLLVYRLS